MTISMYDPRSMIAALELMPPVGNLFRTLFIGGEEVHNSRMIDIDIYKGGRKLAPYVSPVKEGKVITKNGFTTRSVKTPYVKSKYDITAVEAAKRLPGEALYAALTPSERANKIMARLLDEGRRDVERLIEFQVSQAMVTGKVTATGKDDNAVDWSVEVDYQRAAGQTIALAAGHTWTTSTVDPMANLRTWRNLGMKNGLRNMTEVVMGEDAAAAFLANALIQKRQLANANWFKTDSVDMSGFNPEQGATYLGTVDGFNLYTYTQWYEHPTTGTLTEMMPAKKIVMGAKGTRNMVHFGAIQDIEFSGGAIEQRIFPKSWTESDPSVRWLLLQSSPLVALHEPDATLCAEVVA